MKTLKTYEFACKDRETAMSGNKRMYHRFAFSLLFATLVAGILIPSARATVDDANENGSVSPGGGDNSLSFKADLFSGKFTYAVPIVVAPGRQKAEPTLALGYNSGNGNGWCGVGWSLDVGFIQRDTRKGVPVRWNLSSGAPIKEYDDSKGFVASVASASSLVLVSPTNQNPLVYRQEVEASFMTYNYYTNNHWEIVDKSGNTFFLGEAPNSRMENTNSGWATNAGSSTFKWMLSKVIDVNGNLTTLTYTNIMGQVYLAKIDYNGNTNTPVLPTSNTVEFKLADRPDTNITFTSGYRVMTTKRLSEILVTASGENARKYVLNYDTSPSTLRSLLKSVTQYGSDLTSTLPAITFNYQVKPFEFENTNTWSGLNSQGQTGNDWNTISDFNGSSDYQVKTIDVDGDGLPDRIMRKQSSPYNAFYVERNTGSNFVALDAQGKPYHWTPLDSQDQTGNTWNSVAAVDGDGATHVDLADINGDGYPDRVMRSKTNSFDVIIGTNAYGNPIYETHYTYTNFWVQFNSGFASNNITQSSFSLKTLWGGVTNQVSDESSTWGSIRWKKNVDFMDMNGDGLPDRVSRKYASPYTNFVVQLNNGSGFGPSVKWYPVQSQGHTSQDWNSLSETASDNTYVMLADINGDGLPDRVMRNDTSPYTNFVVQFNNGAGFEPETNWMTVDRQGSTSADWGSPIGSGGKAVWASLLDINGDGLPDRVMRSKDPKGIDSITTNIVIRNFQPVEVYTTNYIYTNWVVQLNTGTGFAPATNWGGINSQDRNSDQWNGISYRDADGSTVVDCFDINGDGLPDRVMRKLDSPFNAYVVQLNKGPFPDLMSTVSNGIGGSVQVSYIPSTTLDNRNTNWVTDPWREGTKSLLPYNTWVVSQIATYDGLGWAATNTYAYKGGYNNPEKREFRGFAQVEVTDPAGTKTRTYFHQSGGRDNSALGEYLDQNSVTKKGLPYRVELIGSDGATNKITLSKIEEVQLHSNGWYFPFISQNIEMSFEGLTTYRATAKQLVYETDYGNLVKEISLGEVSSVNIPNHSFTTNGPVLYTHYTYANLGNIRSKPSDVKITSDANGTVQLKESLFRYDNRGNITNAEVWLDTAGAFITTASTVYDQYGNPVETTDAAGVKTTVIYDSLKQYGNTQITGTFTNQFAHDPKAGLLIQGIDPKGLVASNYYDVFYRTKETYISTTTNGPPNLWRSRMDYSVLGISNGFSLNYVRKRVNDAVDALNGQESYVYSDGLGRTLQSRTEAENGQFRVSNVLYDQRGNAYYSTLPYFSSGTANTKLNGTYLGSLTEFDGVGRQFRVTPAVQTVFNASGQLQSTNVTGGDTGSPVGPVVGAFSEGTNPWVSIATDSEGKVKKSYQDAFGRITNIVEVTSEGNFTTTFIYDLLGNLTNVTDHAGNVTRLAYDSLGRKISMTDPDMGTWSYNYDNSGRLIQQIDARTNKIKFYFNDVLGRMTSKEVYNAANQLVGTTTWIYDVSDDQANYPVYKGQLYKVTDQQGYQRSGYDVRGRVLKSSRFLNINSMEYVSQSTYDDADRVTQVIYPGNSATIQYSYDTAGNLIEVRGASGTGSQEIFYAPQAFNELGQVTSYAYGNGVVTTNAMFPNSKRIQSLGAKVFGTNIQNLNYTYDKVSNVKSIGDTVYTTGLASASLSSIQYDDLHRLVSVNSTARGTKTYAYNAIGNVLTNQDYGTNLYQYGVRPHAVTSANGKSYSYDACGNMTVRGSQTLAYDEQNQLVRVTEGSNTVVFGYAEGGERLWRSGTNGYTIWMGAYEINNGKVLCHVFAGGKRVASFEPQCTAGFSKVFGEERWFAAIGGLTSIMNWPFEEGRGPWCILAATFAGILAMCMISRRKLSSNSAAMRQAWSLSLLWKQTVTLTFIASLIVATSPTAQAQSYNPVFYYYHGDHLGSSNLMTDRSGNVVQHYENASYGSQTYKENSSAFAVSNRYTGQILDEQTGLYYYGARYYDCELGRFIQPDTIVPSAANPQTLNRYAYCGNNPLKYVDPSGHIGILAGIVIGIVVGAAIGGATAAATGGNIWMGILCGAIGGAFGGIGAGIGQVLGGTLGAFTGAVVGGTAGGAVTAAISGGDIGVGALAGAIAGGIGFCVGQLQIGMWGGVTPKGFGDYLMGLASSAAGSSIGGGIGSVLQGGNFWDGAAIGAIGGAIGYVLAQSLATYLSEESEPVFPEGKSQNLSGYNKLGAPGILTGQSGAQSLANESNYPWMVNPSQGPINDILQAFWQKALFGFGDSLAKQYAGAFNQLGEPGNRIGIGHSQGGATLANAASMLQGAKTLRFVAPAANILSASYAARSAGATMIYSQHWFEISDTFAPSFCPAKFISGFGGVILIGRHNAGSYMDVIK